MALLDMIKFGGQGNPMQQQQMMGLLGLQNGVPNAGGAETGTGMAPPPPAAPMPAAAPSGGAVPPPAEPTWMDKVKGLKDNPMFWLSLSNGLAGMGGGSPNTGMQQMSQMGMQHILKQRAQKQEQEQVAGRANQTADAIEKMGGPNSAETAAMIRNDPANALKYASTFQTSRLKAPPTSYTQKSGADLGMTGPDAAKQFNVSSDGKITGIGSGGVVINNEGSVPAGYVRSKDPATGEVSMMPAKGTKDYRDMKASEEKALGRQDQKSRAALTVVSDLERGLGNMKDTFIDTGNDIVDSNARILSSKIAGTEEYKLQKMLTSARANIGVDQIMQMKANSETGGALGAIPFQQQERMEQLLGALDIGLGYDELENNMMRVQNIYLDGAYGTKRNRDAQIAKQEANPEAYAEGGPLAGDYLDPAFNKQIEKQYKLLDFDKHGNPWPIQTPPQGWDDSQVPENKKWKNLTDRQRKKYWGRWAKITEGGQY